MTKILETNAQINKYNDIKRVWQSASLKDLNYRLEELKFNIKQIEAAILAISDIIKVKYQ